ncbi:hypothetical protein [uncultured Dysosmobacter sp.]|uniref:hypothetical protein n=1 Tax=uncultured Dysosmobacter sp. TaxID=2591384 RepID=UPI0026277A42|nr:hypothetical protein [uncultured Dysosmobacter sp.]
MCNANPHPKWAAFVNGVTNSPFKLFFIIIPLILFAIWGSAQKYEGNKINWEITGKFFEKSASIETLKSYYIVIEAPMNVPNECVNVKIPFKEWDMLQIGEFYPYPSEIITNWEYYFEGKRPSKQR